MRCFHLFILLHCLSLPGAVLFQRTLTVPENACGCVRVVICAPDSVKGFRVTDASGAERLLGLVSHLGGRWEFFFNGARGQYRLKYLDEPSRHYSAAPKSGLFHLCRTYDNREINSLKEFLEAWKQHPESERRCWESQIFIGCNALGPPGNAIHLYRGVLRIPADGDYTFHTCSTDASLLIVDGHQLALLPGKNAVDKSRRGQFCGRLKLRKGEHAIEYWHANSRNDTYAIAAYSLPKATNMTILPVEWFLPVPMALLSPLEDSNGRPVTEFSWEDSGTLMVGGWRLGDEQLRMVTYSNGERWVFDDETPIHFNGYTIVSPTNYAPFPPNDQQAALLIDTLGMQLIRKGGSDNLHRLFLIGCRTEHRSDIAIKYLAHLHTLKQPPKLPPKEVLHFYRSIIRPERTGKEQYAQLQKDLQYLEHAMPDVVNLELARLAFYINRDDAQCAAFLAKCNSAKLPDEEARTEWRILDADRTLFAEGYDASLAKYNALPSPYSRMDERAKLELDGRILALRNALITGQIATLPQELAWAENRHPGCRVNAEYSWMKSRLLQLQKRPQAAKYFAEASLRMQPMPNTRSSARLYLAQCALEHGNTPVALDYLKALLKEDPHSREAVTAAKLMENRK